MNILDLPCELLDEIFNHISDLKTASLVCKIFHHAAQRIAERKTAVVFSSSHDLVRFK
jgi:hypothetical protein